MTMPNPVGSVTWENRLFAIGFIKDAPLPYYVWAERLSRPAAYFKNDQLWEMVKKAGAYGDYWRIISAALEKAIEQRKIFISNVSIERINDPKYSHKMTLAEVRFIQLPANKYVRFSHRPYEVFAPGELSETYKPYLPIEILTARAG